MLRVWVVRPVLFGLFALALMWAQFQAGVPELSAHLDLQIDPVMP
jgi:hypothetical protein